VRDAALRKQLETRRQRLRAAADGRPRTDRLLELLREIDGALERMDAGTFGVCDTCHEDIESDRMLADPLARNCIDHLSPAEQRALGRDLDLAFQVQRGLLPPPGAAPAGWSVAYHYEPAGPVSGDYCDLIPGEPAALFAVGDVSGKGVAASMLMAQLHAIFRSLAPGARGVTDLLGKANRIFGEGAASAHFATLVCGRLGGDGAVEVCNAGHCYPLHVRGNAVAAVESTDFPLGLFPDAEYRSRGLRLERGDCLVLYTDGLSEAVDRGGGRYGTRRLADLLSHLGARAPKELLTATLADLDTFRSGAPRADDLTVMVLRREA
jgi:sigma-B regulation protein RsbU (phosphoserine phosphatase)